MIITVVVVCRVSHAFAGPCYAFQGFLSDIGGNDAKRTCWVCCYFSCMPLYACDKCLFNGNNCGEVVGKLAKIVPS